MSVRSFLRSATRTHHDRVDAAFGGFDLTKRDDYERFLTAHARAFPPAEEAAGGAGAARLPIGWPSRRRSPALFADLATLSVHPPLPLAAPQPSSPAELWGLIYVLEGSRMGGRLLARQAAASDDPLVRQAVRYLGETGPSWPRLIVELDKALQEEASAEAAAAMAARTFDLFEAALRE